MGREKTLKSTYFHQKTPQTANNKRYSEDHIYTIRIHEKISFLP